MSVCSTVVLSEAVHGGATSVRVMVISVEQTVNGLCSCGATRVPLVELCNLFRTPIFNPPEQLASLLGGVPICLRV